MRTYTMGYNVVHPTNSHVYHNYDRTYRNVHWLDHNSNEGGGGKPTADERDVISTRRIRQLLEIEDYDIDLGIYGLGSCRTLDQWIEISGIDIRHGRVIDNNEARKESC